MVSATTNIAKIQQSFMNNITQEDQQNCLATTTNTANNNVVIVNGADIKGNFTGVSATTSTDASCLMVSNMEDSVSNILSATISQTNTTETDWFNGFQFTADSNSFNVSQSVTNNISQINQATCAANTTQSASNNYVYVTNATVGGDFVGVTSDATTSANCSMTNTMKNTTYNQAQANAKQSNTIKGMFVAIVSAFAAIIGIIVIGVIILFAVGAIGVVGYEGTSSFTSSRKNKSSQENIEQQEELAEAESSGINPTLLPSEGVPLLE
ncbi:Hypothetical protein HVR_LOCUS1347 [uncultured virus]|nr:Hypothetical protein HVR_LOCUS1347 [uncultured virus]